MEKVKGDIISFMFYPPPPITRFVFNVSLTFAGGDSVAADPPSRHYCNWIRSLSLPSSFSPAKRWMAVSVVLVFNCIDFVLV